jgi:iron complex transport system substrate-binding protein
MTYPRISVEEVIRRKPDVIIISSMQRDRQYIEAREKWFQWPMIPAVRDGRVHLVDSDLLDRPSPRVLDGLEMMARLLHPEVKWK